MSLQSEPGHRRVSGPPLVFEFAFITAILGGLYLWRGLVRYVDLAVLESALPVDGLFASGLVEGGLLVGGAVVVVAVYTRLRDIPRGLTFPGRDDLRSVGAAVVVPVGLVAITKLVGVLTGVTYGSLTKYAVAADAPLRPVALVTGLGILIGVPLLVLVCHLVVQGSLRKAVGSPVAVATTPLVAGFVLLSGTGGLTGIPDRGKLLAAALFTMALGFGTLAAARVEGGRLRALAYAPVLLFVGLVALSGVAGIDSVAGALFILSHLGVLGVAAATYERTGSLLVPALAYTTLLVVDRVVVVAFEAGLQTW